MATVACPGCGLPRDEAETRPCPVCEAAPATGGSHPPRAKKPDADPTAGLPADASELDAPRSSAPARAAGGGSRAPLVAGAFLLGALCGVGGVLGFQAVEWPNTKGQPEVATAPNEAPAVPAPQGPAVAPMPHEPSIPPLVFEPALDADPEVKLVQPPQPGLVITHDINQPDATYSVPTMKRGERIVLRGKVKKLHVHWLDAGAVLDASALEAEVVTVSGRIDNRSTLKLNVPSGTVHVSGKIDGKSVVEILAPGGEVRFMVATTATREGSKIDNGSAVAVTARTVEFRGDITGTDTKVTVTLTRDAWLTVASVSGKATVEYRSQAAGWSSPGVTVGPVAATATFRKID